MATFAYPGATSPLLQDIDINIQLDTRMAIVGPNGAGKTTLLKLLVGKLDPLSGSVTINSRLRIGYFSQHHIDQLDLNMNSLQVLQTRFPGKTDEEYRAQLGAFGLSGPLSLQTIRTLSGGQKSRSVFASLCMQSPHLMILDEPTNHLDMDSIDALINALKVYQGGVVVVSHDKKFIDALCSDIWICKEAHLSRFDGSIHEYSRSLIAGMGKLTH
jgi:ATP-binding cassette subfamily F protein 3